MAPPPHHGGRELVGVMMPWPSFPFPWPGQRGISSPAFDNGHSVTYAETAQMQHWRGLRGILSVVGTDYGTARTVYAGLWSA